MTHEEWSRAVKAALDSGPAEKNTAARHLVQLAARCQRQSRRAVGDWHFEQALGVAALALDDAGQQTRAALLYKRLAQHHARALAYHGRGLASTQTALALSLFAAGQSAAATRIGLEALRAAGQFPDPSSALEKLLGELRKSLNATARRRASGPKRRRSVSPSRRQRRPPQR